MTGEHMGPASDLGQDQQGWVETYRRGLRFRDLEPDYEDLFDDSEDVHGFDPRPEADVQRRIAAAQMDLLFRFTGASDYADGHDPDSWLHTFYALAGKWHGRDTEIDEQLESIDEVLSQTGGPLWRPDLYLRLATVQETAVEAPPATPEPVAPAPTSSWREPPRLIDWTPDEDPAAGYLRELRDCRLQARESGAHEHSENALPVDSGRRLTALARKLSSRGRRRRSDDTHRAAQPPHRAVSGGGLQL
jgi:hypothetical protein